MVTLRDCSTSYTFTQVRAMLAAAMQRELTLAQMITRLYEGPTHHTGGPLTARRAAWLLAARLLPAGGERAPRGRAARPRQRALPFEAVVGPQLDATQVALVLSDMLREAEGLRARLFDRHGELCGAYDAATPMGHEACQRAYAVLLRAAARVERRRVAFRRACEALGYTFEA